MMGSTKILFCLWEYPKCTSENAALIYIYIYTSGRFARQKKYHPHKYENWEYREILGTNLMASLSM